MHFHALTILEADEQQNVTNAGVFPSIIYFVCILRPSFFLFPLVKGQPGDVTRLSESNSLKNIVLPFVRKNNKISA